MSGMLDRLFVDRHVYERRLTGGHVVTFTRRAQLGLALGLTVLLVLCLGLGASASYLWLGGDRVIGRALSRAARSPSPTTAAERGRIDDLTQKLKLLQQQNEGLTHQLAQARGNASAVDGADKEGAQLTALRTQLTELEADRSRLADALRSAQAKITAQQPSSAGLPPAPDGTEQAASSGNANPVELAVVLRERDAARQQLESLMASTTQLKAELDRLKAKPLEAPSQPAAISPPEDESRVARLQHDVGEMETAVDTLSRQLLDSKHQAAAREEALQKKLGQARFEQQEVMAERDGLRQRVEQLEATPGAGSGAAGRALAQPASMRPAPGDAELVTKLQAALARLKVVDPAFAKQLEESQPTPPPSEPAGASMPPPQ